MILQNKILELERLYHIYDWATVLYFDSSI